MSSLFACFIGNRRNPEERTQTQSNNNGVSSSGNRAANKVVVPSHNTEIVYVELLKDQDEPLGLRLEGGIDQDRPAVRVSHLYPGGVAYLSNALQIGDRVLSINGTVTDKLTQSDISALLDNAGCTVNLEIAFITTGTKEGNCRLLLVCLVTWERNEDEQYSITLEYIRFMIAFIYYWTSYVLLIACNRLKLIC
jgi:predicted metalloprotease with PDZ domain